MEVTGLVRRVSKKLGARYNGPDWCGFRAQTTVALLGEKLKKCTKAR